MSGLVENARFSCEYSQNGQILALCFGKIVDFLG